jgi:hypothetical protein
VAYGLVSGGELASPEGEVNGGCQRGRRRDGVRIQAQQGWCFIGRLGRRRGAPFTASQLRYACWA